MMTVSAAGSSHGYGSASSGQGGITRSSYLYHDPGLSNTKLEKPRKLRFCTILVGWTAQFKVKCLDLQLM